jgi:23S rRNA-/tRNA-specific pseudouridylate synthase
VRNEQGGVVTKENIVYEDSDLLILNKNAGINVHA